MTRVVTPTEVYVPVSKALEIVTETIKEVNKNIDTVLENSSREERAAAVGMNAATALSIRRQLEALCNLPEPGYYDDRDCDNCIHKKENGCESWDCEFKAVCSRAPEQEVDA